MSSEKPKRSAISAGAAPSLATPASPYALRAVTSRSARLGGNFEHAVRDTLGYIQLQLGDFAQATAHFESALALSRDHSDAPLEAGILIHLGDARHAAGELPQARQAWQQALAICDDIQHPDADEVRAKLASTLN